ncbi:MAG: hypothetical protein PHW40_01785 [Candidatus Izemoplasmatales bacterium]|jgi:hypothetical protein|nr:hypothetical protein [Candidatus Izemoplasmatales bacterium]
MKTFFRRIQDAEFLPIGEVRKLKVILVMAFLLLITAATIPFSIYFAYPDYVTIIVLSSFVLVYGLMIALLRMNRVTASTQISIIYSIGLTLFYSQGTSSFYAYLFFYITLTIIIFYQDFLSYLSYGLLILALGIYYIISHQEGLALAVDVPGFMYIYIFTLVLFYLIFFAQILYNEKLHSDMNDDWVKMNQVIDKYHDDITTYLELLRKQAKREPLHEERVFQKLVGELAVFVAEQVKDKGKDIMNVFDLYLYVHERGIEKILENEEISVQMKRTADRLNHYLFNRRTDMYSMLINFSSRFLETEKYKPSRYEYHIQHLAQYHDEQLIAFVMIYQYLVREVCGVDAWDQMNKVLTIDEIDQLFKSPEIEAFFSPQLIALYFENRDLFISHFVSCLVEKGGTS